MASIVDAPQVEAYLAQMLGQNLAFRIAVEGRKYYSSDADQNDVVTGQTSFADTTPTFLLRNPSTSGVVCIPLFYQLNQTGTVAGGDIGVVTELSPERYASGGTSERVRPGRIAFPANNQCALFSGATAAAGYGIKIAGATLGPDVSPAEGAIQEYLWTPVSVMDVLDPGTNLLVYTYAGSTGPSWHWVFCWAEIPPEWLR